MDDFPLRLAEFLESIATRVRALTVDRANKVVRLATLGVVAAALALMALVFLALTIYQALEIPLRPWGAFGVIAGIFVLAGMFLWSKRGKDTT